jgi:flagellar motor switch protein FliN/FliY
MDMLMDVSMQVTVELGRTQMTVRQVLDLQHGSVVELDRLAGEAVDIYVNDHMIARGEVVVVDDKFGVRITELIAPKKENGAS